MSKGEDLRNIFKVSRKPVALSAPDEKKNLLGRDLVLMIARDLDAFEKVHSEGFVDFMKKYKIIETKDDLPDRRTLARGALDDVYLAMQKCVMEEIARGPRCAAITLDIWTNRYRRRAYITFTYRHINADFVLRSFTLSTHLMKGRHTGEAISDEILNLKEKFALSKKTLYAVTDRGANVKKGLILAGLENGDCIGHGIHNLVMRDGIEKVPQVNALTRKLKCGVKTLRYRATELEEQRDEQQALDEKNAVSALHNAVEIIGSADIDNMTDSEPSDSDSDSSVSNDRRTQEPKKKLKRHDTLKTFSETRWNGLLHLCESVFSFKSVVNQMLRKVDKPRLALSPTEWDNLEGLIDFLSLLKMAVELLSGEESPTSNKLLVLRSEIKSKLQPQPHDSPLIRSMKETMMSKFQERFPVTKLAVTAALLDSRFQNLTEVENYLLQHGVTKSKFLADRISEWVLPEDLPSSLRRKSSADRNIPSSSSQADLLSTLAKKHSTSANDQGENESEIEAECAAFLSNASSLNVVDGDVLGFWRRFAPQYPWTATLARFVLAVPATSTPSERVFSIAGMTVSAKRSSLSPVTVNKLVFVHDNYKFCKESVIKSIY